MMPVLFFGHGSPMNAIQDNAFTRTLTEVGKNLPKPKAILCISAHWTTQGTLVTSSDKPRMIYDMYGFPEELYKIKYDAAGDPKLAQRIQSNLNAKEKKLDLQFDEGVWGLDHGTWSILKYLFPVANIPVLQLSLNMMKGPDYHLEIGKLLQFLRESGVLIIGSGNIAHNLRNISWDENEPSYDWAVEFDEWFKEKLIQRDFNALANDYNKTKAGQLSVPTLEHYLPIHYILGAAKANDELKFEFEGMQNASISMRSFRFG
jgi:4,5-DOPA dioxygenase extradiol